MPAPEPKYSNYSNQAAILKANNTSGALAIADDIAFSYTDNTTDEENNPQFVVVETVKDKIDNLDERITEIEEGEGIQGNITASDVTYNNGTVEDTLDNVLDSLGNYVDQAETAANTAQTAYQNVQTAAMLANSQVTQIQEAAQDLTVIKQDYTNINNIANQLQASLNVDANIQVLTEEAYAALTTEEKNNGSIYMLYNTITDGNHYMVVGIPFSPTMGIVRGSNNNAYEGQTVTLVATPNTGYTFTHWSNVDGEPIQVTGDTLTILASQNVIYMANFEQEQL